MELIELIAMVSLPTCIIIAWLMSKWLDDRFTTWNKTRKLNRKIKKQNKVIKRMDKLSNKIPKMTKELNNHCIHHYTDNYYSKERPTIEALLDIERSQKA